MTTPLPTKQRNALWNAVDHWPALSTVFGGRKFRMEHDVNAMGFEPTGFGELPAISITPTELTTEWLMQKFREFKFLFDVNLYCTRLEQAEQLLEDVTDAVFKCENNSGVPYYTAEGTNAHPPRDLKATIQPGVIGDAQKPTACWKVTITFGMCPRKDVVR